MNQGKQKENHINCNNKEAEDMVKKLVQQHLKIWWQSQNAFPHFNKKVSFLDQYHNGRKLEGFRKELSNELRSLTKEGEIGSWSNKLLSIIKKYEEAIVGYDNHCIDFFIAQGYSAITEGFINEVRSFDPQIDVYDIFQAIRNVWIMNSIQILFDIEVKLTPSIFSYSMLYPYSDNFLDDPKITTEEKVAFNNRFRGWLQGSDNPPTNENESKIKALVKRIEDEYPREEYEQVFNSLLAIHMAQEQSLLQQRGRVSPYEKDIIGITFEKGGTSVLADGYLIKGQLTDAEKSLMFGYGVFLQLIDDLQDVEDDYKNGHMTIFSQAAYKWHLDHLTNKLFWFVDEILNNESFRISPNAAKIKEVISDSCRIMIMEAISKNKKFFSRGYLKRIESYSILRFSYMKKMKAKFNKSLSSEDLQQICTALSSGSKEQVIEQYE